MSSPMSNTTSAVRRSSSAPANNNNNRLRAAATQIQQQNQQKKSVKITAAGGGSGGAATDKQQQQKLAVVSRFSSREKQLQRQKQLELARRGKKTLDGREISAEYHRVIYLVLVIAVLCLALMTTVSNRWTRSSNPVVVNTTSVSVYTEIGVFKSCACASFNDGISSCSKRTAIARVVQAFSILMVMSETCGVIMFFFSSYISLNPNVELGVVLSYVFSCVCCMISWITIMVLRGTACSGGSMASTATNNQKLLASYSGQGYSFYWAFGIRIFEFVLLLVLVILFILRKLRRVSLWPVVFLMQLVILPLSIVTTSTNEWMKGGSSYTGYTGGGGQYFAGPWGICSCDSITSSCSVLASQYRATQGLGIVQILIHVGQIALVALVPAWAPNYKERVQIISAWFTWLVQLLFWSVALATFTDCRCGWIQKLNWPFPIVFIAFMVQSAVALFATFQFTKRRVLAWAVQQNFMGAALENDINNQQQQQNQSQSQQNQSQIQSSSVNGGGVGGGGANPIQREPLFFGGDELAPVAFLPASQVSPPRGGGGGGLEQPTPIGAFSNNRAPMTTTTNVSRSSPEPMRPQSRFTVPGLHPQQQQQQQGGGAGGFASGKFRIPSRQ